MSEQSSYFTCFDAFGYVVRVESNVPLREALDLHQLVLRGWHRSSKDPQSVYRIDEEQNSFTLWHDGELLFDRAPRTRLELSLTRHCHLQIATHSPRYVFVHAGVVQTEHGLLLLPGATFAGKSTLIKSLVELGCVYFSDEYAVVNDRGEVLPFLRGVRLRDGSRRVYWDAPQRAPSMTAAAVKAIYFLDYEPGESLQPRRLSSSEALTRLLEHTVNARERPQESLSSLTLLTVSAQAFESRRGESEQAARRLIDLLSEDFQAESSVVRNGR